MIGEWAGMTQRLAEEFTHYLSWPVERGVWREDKSKENVPFCPTHGHITRTHVSAPVSLRTEGHRCIVSTCGTALRCHSFLTKQSMSYYNSRIVNVGFQWNKMIQLKSIVRC